MFLLLLIACLLAATVHSLRLDPRTPGRIGELFLRYVLVGYCGVPMLIVSLGILAVPGHMAAMLPVGAPTQLLAFFGWAYLGMSLIAIMTLRYRGTFLVAPAVCWAVYFAGATIVHRQDAPASHGDALHIFATHGLIAVILAVALVATGLLSNRPVGDDLGPSAGA